MKDLMRLLLLTVFCLGLSMNSVVSADDLESGFVNPPDSARPWVYWFWLNGNITREGITADLEAMKRVGVGGVLIMEVDQGVPVGPIDFMGDPWRDLFKHVVSEAQRLGLEVNMNNDAGWNGSGGPWIKPEQSMQKVVFSETAIDGPKPFDGVLSQPQAVANFYRDICVQAFPAVGDFRIDNIQVKACYQTGGAGPAEQKELPAEMVIDGTKIVDLTSEMDSTGRLVWEVPAGKWTIVRFGHTSTGVENAPAPASGRGLECDKLSREGIEANFSGMMGKLFEDVGPLAGKALISTHIDSWENGAQNWTARMREEFQNRRGYDLMPFLPVMTGRVVDSHEISERFLWDLRQTISDLIAENYAGGLKELSAKYGARLSIEAYGGPCDDMPYAGRCDEPMGEFWIGGGALSTCKEMASAAHTYGKRIVGAESFTAGDQERWLDHPGSIKALGDKAFCNGINRFVFHRYALQPWLDRKPGMTMGPWGTHYERTQTWWEQTPAWHQYLGRCQFMLRQGLFVADICYLQPETAPQGFNDHKRNGYDFDNCSAETVITSMSVKDGRLVLPDGMSYRVLVLPDTPAMTPQLLTTIRDLVDAGATVLGRRPQRAPGLTEYPNCDEEVKRLADELWADCDGQSVKQHALGKGRMVCGMTPEALLNEMGFPPDLFTRSRVNYIHRRDGDTDIYFVANPNPYAVDAACAFRAGAADVQPEIWRPDSGRIESAAVFSWKDGVTNVPLSLDPSGSVFVVFRRGSKAADPVMSVMRDSRPVLTAAEAQMQITVEKAAYGPPGDAQRAKDVRAEIQRRVDAGEYVIPVSQLASGGDPAAGVLKTLAVEYTVGNRRFSVSGSDQDSVHITVDLPKIVIEKATYGVFDDPKRTRDVKSKLQHLVDTGEFIFDVARMAQGDDPAFMVVKTLIVECTIDGEHKTFTGIDPDTITLALPPTPTDRVAEMRCGTDGKPMLLAWQNGKYEVKTASGQTKSLVVADIPASVEIGGPWSVQFPPNWGAPEQIELGSLMSLSEHSDPGVKYFSGASTYTKTFTVDAGTLGNGRRIDLDLGKVYVMVDVKLNGKDLGTLWKAPYMIDVTDSLRAGENTLEFKVANLWVNRLVGDEQLPEDSERNPDGTLKQWPQWLNEGKRSPTGRYTFTTWRLWKKDASLPPSGLIGPVMLRMGQELALE